MPKKNPQHQPDNELRHAAQDLHEAAYVYNGLYGDDFLNEVDRIAGLMTRPAPSPAPRVRRLKFWAGSARRSRKPLAHSDVGPRTTWGAI